MGNSNKNSGICKLSSSEFTDFKFVDKVIKTNDKFFINNVYCMELKWIDEKMFKYIKTVYKITHCFEYFSSQKNKVLLHTTKVANDPNLMYSVFLKQCELNTSVKCYVMLHIPKQHYDVFAYRTDYKENYNTCIEKLLSYSKNISEITITTAFEEMDGKKMDVNNPLFSLYIQCIQRYACLQHDDHLTLAILKLNDEKIQEDFIKNELVIQWDNKIFAVFPKNIIIQIATENNIVISSEYYNNPDLYKKIDNNSNKEKTDNIKEINKEKIEKEEGEGEI